MMNPEDNSQNIFRLAYMNIRGQTELSLEKQLQIENVILQHDLDFLHCQEIDVNEDTFNECNQISSSYNLISNNSMNK